MKASSTDKKIKYRTETKLDGRTFTGFAWYDTFILGSRWRLPAVFAVIMLGLAALCLMIGHGTEGAWMLMAVLAAIGIFIPGGYLLSFHISTSKQAKKLDLSANKPVYCVELSDKEVIASQGSKTVRVGWVSMYRAVRLKRSIALYASRSRAYLLPRGEIDGKWDEIWNFVSAHMPPGKSVDHTKAHKSS